MIENKGKMIEDMDQATLQAGYIKFNLPDSDDIYALSGEGVWGYVSPEDKQKYNDDNYFGKITAILLNQPICCNLNWGDEVVLVCHGSNRPTLDPEFIMREFADPEEEEVKE